MASPDIIDLAKLLAPIAQDSPAGSDVREDMSPLSKYQAIKTARSAARAAERKGMHDGDSTEADEYWRKIITLAPEILATQSKDLEIASWFAEAMIRRHGFSGLRDAFKLIHELIENFWDTMHPMPDEDGMETRTAPLAGLNGEDGEGVLIAPIRKVPLTEGHVSYSFWQYQQALDVNRSASDDIRTSKAEKLGFTVEDIEKAVNESSSEFYIHLLDDISEAIDIYKKVGLQLDQRCSANEVPPTRKIIAILEECRGAISHIGKHKLPVPTVEATPEPDNAAAPGTPSAKPAGVAGAINSRDAAFAQLLEIAKFFRKTEPHSPISYVIEKAVKWGNMPLNELILELIPDSSSRERFSALTGVKNED
ncbi:MAG: type VI secretion system protein TssA [Pseudomonadota bacterium]